MSECVSECVVVQMMKRPNAREEPTGIMIRRRSCRSFLVSCVSSMMISDFKSVQSRRRPRASASDSRSLPFCLANVASAHPVH